MSGIPKSERDPTRVTHYDKAVKFRKTIIEYLEQDFGTDKAYLSDGTANRRYWLIKKIRDNIYDLTHDMLVCITAANSIHIYHIYEYNERRRYFTQAVSDCESILQELNLIIDYLKIKPSKLKKLNTKMRTGEIPYKDIENQYRSWRGTVTRKGYKNYRQVTRMDKLYNQILIEPFIEGSYARC